MKVKSIVISAVLLLVIVVLVAQSAYIVNESEQVVITQFGKPVGDPITTPGLKFKIPFTQTANFFEKRYLEWDGAPNQVPTKDKKYIFVDTYARWQITDPLLFFKRFKNESLAQSRLDDILDGETRDFIAKHYLEEAVRNTNRTPVKSNQGELVGDSLIQIKVGREKIQKMILLASNKQTKALGIEILDFRFKRINYVQDVQAQVFARMQSERMRIADKFRSEGQGEASKINGEKERELKNIESEAFKKEQEIKGNADAKAAAIYAEAYDKTTQSRELYSFLKAMETLKKTASQNTSVIISTDSELYRYLKDID
jgi:membrane protease subunit HflC